MATFHSRSLLVGILTLYLFGTNTVFALDTGFSDVGSSSPFYVPISYLKENGIAEGYKAGIFRPEKKVTRAEALTMILKATNKRKTIEVKPEDEQPFLDVFKKDSFYETVYRGKNLGVVTGFEDGKYFKPKANVSLAEALRMIFKSSKTSTKDFSLASVNFPKSIPQDAWYTKDIAYAISKTIVAQKENAEIFPPGDSLNRGELALLLYRFTKIKKTSSFGYASWYGDRLSVIEPDNGKEYLEKHLTAAHLTLPFGTIARVTNMKNGKQINVVINDRGPFVTGRIIDLSKSAFSALEYPANGIISVQVEVLR